MFVWGTKYSRWKKVHIVNFSILFSKTKIDNIKKKNFKLWQE